MLWNHNKKIEWSDFRGKVPNNKGLKIAISSVKILVQTEAYYEGEIPNFIIKSFFNKNKSWTTTGSEKSLIHERLHFEITELFSRRIRQKIHFLNKEGVKDISVYKKAYRKLLIEHGVEQRKYDKEVYFNKVKQKDWIENIYKELEKLEGYK